MGRPAQEGGPERPKVRARGREEEREPVDRAHHAWSRVGPAWQRLGSPCGGSTRRGARVGEGRGARARFAVDADAAGPRAASRLTVERAHGEGLTGVGSTRSWLSWRRRGAYVAATRAGGRESVGGGLRRPQPAERKGENGDEVTRGRFPAERASTRLRESVASVGLGGATPSEAGDERVLRSSGGDGGEHTASDGNGRGGAG
uniref:Epstein-Barr virus EBNA-1-like protein n=1 Tax=Oryza sativa subsp. japonica TaxID=39947 RepID=Q7XHL1_ORYSJ|nr:Epstein-Barr virus EBNA-1-like protein [Oryza sativa Japonica Group]BAD31726.1 Epstein-Barr virus EBNA-1-like protein [Oryza sativa Japonica Group]